MKFDFMSAVAGFTAAGSVVTVAGAVVSYKAKGAAMKYCEEVSNNKKVMKILAKKFPGIMEQLSKYKELKLKDVRALASQLAFVQEHLDVICEEKERGKDGKFVSSTNKPNKKTGKKDVTPAPGSSTVEVDKKGKTETKPGKTQEGNGNKQKPQTLADRK